MFNLRMTSAWTGTGVASLRRIERPVLCARPRQDQVDGHGMAIAGGSFQPDGTPKA